MKTRLKKILLKISIQNIIKSFKQHKHDTVNTPKEKATQGKYAKRVDQLKDRLVKLNRGYIASIRKLQIDYDRKNLDYQKAYNDYQIAIKKYTNKVISEDDLKEIKGNLEPYEQRVRSAGYELEKVEGYLRDDVVEIVTEIEGMQDKYTTEIAGQLKREAEELQQMKQAYIDKVNSIGRTYKEVIDTKNLVNHSMKAYQYTYDSKVLEMLETRTNELPLNDLVIDEQLINKTLQNKKS